MSYVDGNTTITYTYNEEGIRTSKTITTGNNVTRHDYILSGSQIVRETVYLNDVEQYTLVYFYDENGAPLGMKYRTPTYANGVFDGYIFEKNLQGDIVAIYDLNTNKIVEYKYDAWGNATVEGTQASTIGVINPLRYRGYYFDNEIDLYYIQSRYYNAEWSRFLNVDSYISTGQGLISFNMFAYCLNEPVGRIEIGGYASVDNLEAMEDPLDKKTEEHAGGGGKTNSSSSQNTAQGNTSSAKKGWRLGQSIKNLTKKGTIPKWPTVKSRFWKNEALNPSQPYSEANLARMRKGLAPIGKDGYSMELHHPNGRGGANFFNFYPVLYTEHFSIHYGRLP